MTVPDPLLERLERLRRLATQEPAAAPIAPDPDSTHDPPPVRPPGAKPGPSAPVPKHWSEVESADEDDVEESGR